MSADTILTLVGFGLAAYGAWWIYDNGGATEVLGNAWNMFLTGE